MILIMREKFRDIIMESTNDVCFMRHVAGREEMGVKGGMNKCVGWCRKREELLRNGFREEIGLPIPDTRHREWL